MRDELDDWWDRWEAAEHALRFEDRRTDAQKQAERLAAAEDWQGLVAARDELAGRAHSIRPGESEQAVDLRIDVMAFNEPLAFLAPPEFASEVLRSSPLRTQRNVLADRFTWEQLEPWLTSIEDRRWLAYERVVRGEDLTGAGLKRPPGAPPFALAEWEPRYWMVYEHPADFVRPPEPPVELLPPTAPEEGDFVCRALGGMVEGWRRPARARAKGDARRAVAATGILGAGFARCSVGDAMGVMAVAAANGGAYSGEMGLARGRERTWKVLAALAGARSAVEPPPDEALARVGAHMRWWKVTPAYQEDEWIWQLSLVVEDTEHRVAWAITAADSD